ncbi:MAG: type VI secretion system baseplate subunit TssE [Gammaproteobacteria bacterium]|nr:type VI secretion system baseplate subunit TssE [Gammaproteobacteria bacterium]
MNIATKQIQAPLLHRLTDHAPENSIDAESGRYVNFADLQTDIKQNLEQILNARLSYFGVEHALSEIKQSVLNYGIPDFTRQYSHFKKHQKELCQNIQDAIICFEPRLQQVKVGLVDSQDKNSRILTIRISGMLSIKPDSQVTVFESSLDIVRYQFTFKDES